MSQRGVIGATLVVAVVAAALPARAQGVCTVACVQPPTQVTLGRRMDSVFTTVGSTLGLAGLDQSGGVSGAIGAAFGGGAGGSGARGFAPERANQVQEAFDALAYAATGPSAVRQSMPRWSLWTEARGTQLDGEIRGDSLTARQINISAGVDYRASDAVVIGMMAGHEQMRNRLPALDARLEGDGWSVGPYLGVRLDPRTVFEASVVYTRLDYSATTGAVVGDFEGNRVTGVVGLVQTWQLGALTIEPSIRGFALHERQSAFSDTGGNFHPGSDINVYGVMMGPQFSTVVPLGNGMQLTPAVGAYLDVKSVEQDTPASGATSYALRDGASARFTGAVALQAGDVRLSVGGNVAGIGTGDQTIWALQGHLAVRF